MSEAHGTAPNKPSKPYPEFPLFPHATGRWAKKIRGKMHYFGPWADPNAALTKYLEQKDDLHAGRTSVAVADAVTVKSLANSFLNSKSALMGSGELSPRTWVEYKAAADLLVTRFGKQRLAPDVGPKDFATLRNHMAKMWGLHRLANTIQYVRSVFKYGLDAGLLDRPVRFGPDFKKPTKRAIRLHRASLGLNLFSADEIRRMLDASGLPLRAMILLGINCGFGNADCGTLPAAALDLDSGWVNYARPKTGIERRCPLWPETIAALRDALAKRPAPKLAEDGGLVFLTKRRQSWAKDIPDSPISKEMRKALDKLDISGRRNFYTLRHTFRTVADESKDQPAVDFIMGHEVPHMSAVYRETISDVRLRAVADHVGTWLFGMPKVAPTPSS